MATRLTRKKAVLGIVMTGAVILVAGILWWALIYRGQKTDGMTLPVVPVNDVPVAALSYGRSGDVDGGLAYYDSQVAQRKDVTDKQRLLLYKSDFALEMKRPQVAVSAAMQADHLKTSLATTISLARAYEGTGDKRQAVVYYKKALSLAPKDGAGSRFNVVWEKKVKELES